MASCEALRVASGQIAGEGGAELGGASGIRRGVGGETRLPALLRGRAGGARVPLPAQIGGNVEAGEAPAQRRARRRRLVGTERSAMRIMRPRQLGRTPADHGLAADESRLVARRERLPDRRVDRLGVMPVDIAADAPATGLEALRRVVGEPALDMAVDGDAVIVVESAELAEAERPRQRAGF